MNARAPAPARPSAQPPAPRRAAPPPAPARPTLQPFLWLARKLTGDGHLEFTEAPALPPPEAVIDDATRAAQERELQEAAAMPLPADDDDDL